jgi:hypothetical protein
MLIVVVLAVTVGYEAWSGSFGLIGPQPEILVTQTGRLIKVPPGGNLQAAIDQAAGGDVIELQAGAVYKGQINLPAKAITEYITIQSSRAADLPPDKRVSPNQRHLMATIVTGMLGRAAVSAANGAHHYRFIGIEFTPSGSFYNYGVVVLGNAEAADKLPHHIEIDRSYIHPHETGRSRRGIALNSAETVIKNSYIEGFGYRGEETQGICGWTGTRNVKIINNYIEGGAENIMFGGADPASPELIPSDIEIRGNHLNKPEAWSGKRVTVKTLFELKNAKRVQFVGNLLTNNWDGSAFRITVRNQEGRAPFSTIEDVVIRDNVIDGAGDGINILGRDDNFPSDTLKRLTIENNLFLNIAGRGAFDGSGYFVQIAEGEDIKILRNTVFNSGNIATLYGTLPKDLVFANNITGHGNYGIHGPIDLRSARAEAMFKNNVFMNLNNVPASDLAFPKGNTMVRSSRDVGFMDAARGDYRVAPTSKFKCCGSNIPGRTAHEHRS